MQQQDTAAASQASRSAGVIAGIAVLAAIVLRTIEFMRDRPLWLDEAMLALNIASRSFTELARPLDYDQSAPLLYLWIERLAVTIGGVSEQTLRVLPFIAGLVLVPVVWVVARRLADAATGAVAAVLIAVSFTLVTFSAEAKQYGVDPLATLIAVWLATRVVQHPEAKPAWAALAVGGVGCLLLSQPSVFVLAGALAALVADVRVRRVPDIRRRLAVVGAVWAATFLVLYVVVYRATAQSAYMRQFWAGTFLDPRAPDFLLRLRLFDTAAFAAPTLTGQALGAAGMLAIAWCAGVWTLWRRSRAAAVLVAVPLALAALAAALGLYPVMDRLFLFAAPLTAIAYASLIARAVDLTPTRAAPMVLAGACAALALIAAPTHARRIANPVFNGAGKQVIADVDSMTRAEPVYVAARSFPLWVYYTTDWDAPDRERLHWAASIASAGAPAHNNAPPRGRAAADTSGLSRRYRGRIEIVGMPTGRQYRTTTRTLSAAVAPTDLAEPRAPDTGWAQLDVERMASVARQRLWVFGSHMFALDGAEPGLVAELQRRGVRLVMERRQGSTVGYHVEFPGDP